MERGESGSEVTELVALDLTRRTVRRDGTKARVWLHAELGGDRDRA